METYSIDNIPMEVDLLISSRIHDVLFKMFVVECRLQRIKPLPITYSAFIYIFKVGFHRVWIVFVDCTVFPSHSVSSLLRHFEEA